MVNSLNDTQSVGNSTATPQSAGGATGASDGEQFQKSADAGVLNQNKSVSVTSTGQPAVAATGSGGISSGAVVFIIVASIALLLLASSVFRWMLKRPEPAPKAAKTAKKPVESKPVKNSRKKSRAERHKK